MDTIVSHGPLIKKCKLIIVFYHEPSMNVGLYFQRSLKSNIWWICFVEKHVSLLGIFVFSCFHITNNIIFRILGWVEVCSWISFRINQFLARLPQRPRPLSFISSPRGGQAAHYKGYCKDSIAWWHHQMKHFPRYWPFVRGIRRSPVNSPHKSQWRWALLFSLICAWINGWVNNDETGDLRRHRAHYDVTVMW